MEKVTTNTKQKNSSKKTEPKAEKNVEVLYQRLGGRWFAFSVVNDEIFFGEVPNDAIDPDAKSPENKPTRTNRAA